MHPQDMWLGRVLLEKGLVEREDLSKAAAALDQAGASDQPRLLAQLVEDGVFNATQAAWVVEKVKPEAEARAKEASDALEESWADVKRGGAEEEIPDDPYAPIPGTTPPTTPPSAPAPGNAVDGEAPLVVLPDPPAPPPLPTELAPLPPMPQQGGTPSGRRASVSGRTGPKRGASQKLRAESVGGGGGTRVIAATLLVAGLIAVAVILLNRRTPEGPEPGSTAGGGSGAAVEQPSAGPPPHLQGEIDVASLEERGRYADAIRRAREVVEDAACDPSARARLLGVMGRLERFRAFQVELEEALAEGPSSRRLQALIVQVENDKLTPELAQLSILEGWRARARSALGADAYGALISFGFTGNDGESTAWVGSPLKGHPKRKELLEQAAKQGAARVEAVRKEMAAEVRAAAERVSAEAERAMTCAAALASPIAVPAHRGRPAGAGRLAVYDARGFTLKMADQKERRFTWSDAPASTACDVLDLALDPEDAEGRMRVARVAARGALFPRAEAALAAAKKLDPARSFPPLDTLQAMARLVRGAGTVEPEKVELSYAFDDASEELDFRQGGYGWARCHQGSLRITCAGEKPGTFAYAIHGVGFDQGFSVTLVLEPIGDDVREGELLVGTHEGVAAIGSSGIGTGRWRAVHGTPRAGKHDPAQAIVVEVTRPRGEALKLVVSQGGTTLAEMEHARARWPTSLELGARLGTVRVAEMKIVGHPDSAWLDRVQDRRTFDLERMVDAVETLGETARVDSETRALPVELRPTSAEDAVCLEGIPERAQSQLELARMWCRVGVSNMATEHAREAVALGRRRYWAAEYLLAQLEARSYRGEIGVPRIRLDQAIDAVDGFAEALALRSMFHLREGRLEAARLDVEAAILARPDYAPARMAMAWLHLRERRTELALEQARLAAALAPDDRSIREEARRVEAQVEGPPWPEPATRESEHFTVLTDMPDKADEFLAALEAVREEAPRLFPSLRARPGAKVQKSRVLLFARESDYYRHAYRTSGDRKENTAGFFDPGSGQLYVFEDPRGHHETMETLRHEATHQWANSLGLALPYWANEAIADYVGGWDEQKQHSRAEPTRTRALLDEESELGGLFELMTMSPAEFYSGNAFLHYAQAWSFVHYCMEGGDPRLKSRLFQYLEQHSQGQAGDQRRQSGLSLEHIYADTFHQLDRKQMSEGWWAHVQRLGEEAEVSAGEEKQ